jgi:putative PIN family toxin of toxin-antitoxin system
VKVVLDSNIYVSAFYFDRGPERIVDLGISGKFKVYSSLYIIAEVKRVLHEKLGAPERFAVLSAERIKRHSTVVPVRGGIKGPIPTDPKDGPIVKTCLACRADFLVTRDVKLARLPIRGTDTLNAAQFLNRLRMQGIIA